MPIFSISDKSDIPQYNVSAKSVECLKTRNHIATDMYNNKVLFQYDDNVHQLQSREDALWNYLYGPPREPPSSGLMATGIIQITQGGKFYTKTPKRITTSKAVSAPAGMQLLISMSDSDSSNSNYIFKVGEKGSLGLTNITIENFKDTSINIIDFSGGGDLSIQDCTFSKNTNIENNISIRGGNQDQKVTIIRSSFNTISSFLPGAAIHYDNSQGTLNITNCDFSGVTKGGAIYTDASLINLYGINTFENNITNLSGGGAIFVGPIKPYPKDDNGFFNDATTTINIDNLTTFVTNKGPNGGAIRSNKHLTITGKGKVVFNQNYANNGGAIYSIGNLILSPSVETPQFATYDNNKTNPVPADGHGREGGAILIKPDPLNSSPIIKIHYAVFSGNDADIGGAVSLLDNDGYDASVNILHSNFTNGIARLGGAVSLGGLLTKETLISDCSFVNNKAQQGGAIYFHPIGGHDLALDLSGSVFNTNDASNQGGGIYVDTTNGTTILGSSTEFSDNSANLGGAIYVKDHNSNVLYLKGQPNQTDYSIDNAGADFKFSNNAVSLDTRHGGSSPLGGAIYCGFLTIDSSILFEKNTSTAEFGLGLAIYSTQTITVKPWDKSEIKGIVNFTNQTGQRDAINFVNCKSVGADAVGSCFIYTPGGGGSPVHGVYANECDRGYDIPIFASQCQPGTYGPSSECVINGVCQQQKKQTAGQPCGPKQGQTYACVGGYRCQLCAWHGKGGVGDCNSLASTCNCYPAGGQSCKVDADCSAGLTICRIGAAGIGKCAFSCPKPTPTL